MRLSIIHILCAAVVAVAIVFTVVVFIGVLFDQTTQYNSYPRNAEDKKKGGIISD